jgi:hypothetical protein
MFPVQCWGITRSRAFRSPHTEPRQATLPLRVLSRSLVVRSSRNCQDHPPRWNFLVHREFGKEDLAAVFKWDPAAVPAADPAGFV